MTRPLLIYGSGGLGREVAMCARDPRTDFELVGFVDDSQPFGGEVGDVPVIGDFEALAERAGRSAGLLLYVAIGNIEVHKKIVSRLADLIVPVTFPNIVHPDATFDEREVTAGVGNYVGPGARLTANVTLGSFNIINLNCVLAHDVVLGDRCQINPGAVLNGQDVLGHEVVIGAGAVVLPRTSVGDGAVVAVGAVVGRDVDPGDTVAGNPARVIRRAAKREDPA